MKPNLRPWVANLLLISIGLVAAVALFEISLRISGISYPHWYALDEYTGVALRANAKGWHPYEGGAYVYINNQGLRDKEHTKAKPVDTVRIAVLGDSFTAALNVAVENTFWAVIEKELETCDNLTGRKIEVINFAVPGYGTAQELLTLRHRVWEYDPDIVLLAFFPGNDIVENSRSLKRSNMMPYFTYDHNSEKLVLDASFLNSSAYKTRQTQLVQLGYWLKSHSRIVQVASEARQALKAKSRAQEERELASGNVIIEIGLNSGVYLEPDDPAWQEAWLVTEQLLVAMQNEVVERNSTFFVVVISMSTQAHPDPLVRQEFAQRLGVSDLFYPNSRLKELSAREGFSIIDLAQPFQTYAEEHQLFLHGGEDTQGKGHWNVLGHRLAGQIIEPAICEVL